MMNIVWKETVHSVVFLFKAFRYLAFLVFPFYIIRALFEFIIDLQVKIGSKSYALSMLKIPLAVYCFGTFLTPLPSYIVYVLALLPSKSVFPVLIIAMVFGFFRAILI